ncbi:MULTISPECIES: 16S rRNA (guanine(527)-N(7))-methyltransferase RsmG [unclassified Helicobacter]|uniref:16S rRNA (guanine(527)-N(7))-methyltransferase RsmG n=1 Tax=unclassified Helicobacter TaxID=2593540 RepID=UPI000CF10CB7|nr:MULTISPECIES: 16S rRNA (guanine(527)-N(7))-methyltransferase RsmG [unclassified Helicobacter]
MKQKLEIFSQLLLEWNKVHNLGGNLDLDMVQEYIADSVYPLEFIKDFKECMDIGSGAGFPAIPLAIKNLDKKFFLVEPRKKRCAFLQYICTELELFNVEILKTRIEDLKRQIQVDLITSRALMPTQDLIALSRKFLSLDGYFLFYKGEDLKNEIDIDVAKYSHRRQRIYFYERNRE